MNRMFRGIFIVWTVWRFGLHELMLSNFKQPVLKILSNIINFVLFYKLSLVYRLRFYL